MKVLVKRQYKDQIWHEVEDVQIVERRGKDQTCFTSRNRRTELEKDSSERRHEFLGGLNVESKVPKEA